MAQEPNYQLWYGRLRLSCPKVLIVAKSGFSIIERIISATIVYLPENGPSASPNRIGSALLVIISLHSLLTTLQRITHLRSAGDRSPKHTSFSRASGYTSPSRLPSGTQTPRELKEEQWKSEAEASFKPGKAEMRSMYKELGGRKSRGKAKLASSGTRDRGGWADGNSDW